MRGVLPIQGILSPEVHPDRSEAEWRDLLFVKDMIRSLRFASLRSAPVGMTGRLFVQIEQPPVLVEREAVGHAGDVVGDQAGAGLGAGLLGALAPGRRPA